MKQIIFKKLEQFRLHMHSDSLWLIKFFLAVFIIVHSLFNVPYFIFLICQDVYTYFRNFFVWNVRAFCLCSSKTFCKLHFRWFLLKDCKSKVVKYNLAYLLNVSKFIFPICVLMYAHISAFVLFEMFVFFNFLKCFFFKIVCLILDDILSVPMCV